MIKHANLVVPVKAKEQETIQELAQKMKETKARYVFIIDEKRAPVGIVSATDVIYRVVAAGKDATQVTCKDIMTSPVKVLTEEDTVKEAYKLMSTQDLYSVPIVSNDGQLLGVLNYDEAVRVACHEKKE